MSPLLLALLPILFEAAKAEAPKAIALVEKAIADAGGLEAVKGDVTLAASLAANRSELAYVLVTAAKTLDTNTAQVAIENVLAQLSQGAKLEDAVGYAFAGAAGDAIVAGMRGDLSRIEADADGLQAVADQAAKDALGPNAHLVDELPPDTLPGPGAAS